MNKIGSLAGDGGLGKTDGKKCLIHGLQEMTLTTHLGMLYCTAICGIEKKWFLQYQEPIIAEILMEPIVGEIGLVSLPLALWTPMERLNIGVNKL